MEEILYSHGANPEDLLLTIFAEISHLIEKPFYYMFAREKKMMKS